jgi:hypothetical protein
MSLLEIDATPPTDNQYLTPYGVFLHIPAKRCESAAIDVDTCDLSSQRRATPPATLHQTIR